MKKDRFFPVAVALLAFVLMSTGCGSESVSENTVRVVVYDRGTDGGKTNPASNKWTQWIQEKVKTDLGLEIVFVPVSRWEEEQAQVTLMASGNPPDLMMTWNLANVTQWGEQGGLYDMAPYIDSHLADVKAFLGPDEALPGRDLIVRNQNMQTGQLFIIPMKRSNTARVNIFMRKDWLDALGLPVPTTHEEFFNALVAFRDRNPGGVSGVLPYVMSRDVRWQVANILESFIDPNISLEDSWVNTVSDRYMLMPGYKEGVRFINRMFNAGLIDPDFPLYSDDVMPRNLISSGRVGAFGHNWDQIFKESEGLTTNLRANVPNAEWIAVDAFPSSDGVTHKISYDPAGLFIFIPSAAKNPEGAMRYLNWLAKFENFNFLQIGPEGIVHEIVDGLPKVSPTAGGGWIQNSSLNMDLTPLHNGLFLKAGEENIQALALSYPFPQEAILQAYNVAMNNARPGPVIQTERPLLAIGPVALTLNQQSEALLVQAIMAPEADFDRVWDEGIVNWLRSGAQAVVDERRANFVSPF